MSDRIEALKLFVRTARTGSFTRAGRELGMSQPVASRTIAALEQDLGAALFTRTTRAVVLTDAGQGFLAHVELILADLDEAYHAVGGAITLRGLLRLGMSSSFAMREIIPRMSSFVQAHPELKIDLLCSDQRQDLVLEGVDVALRMGKLPDSTATARRLGQWKRAALATPGYLERRGTPMKPSDLGEHTLISGPLGADWAFTKGNRREAVKFDTRVRVTLNEAAIAAAKAGLGIVVTGVTEPFEEINAGSLVRVLPDWTLDPIEVHAVYPAGRAAKPAARTFVDFLLEDLRRTPPA